MATSSHYTWSDLPVSPGSVLKEEIEYRSISEKELASLMGRPVQVINEIILGKKEVTHITAIEIQKALGISAQFWLNLESAYRATLAKQEAHVSSIIPMQENRA